MKKTKKQEIQGDVTFLGGMGVGIGLSVISLVIYLYLRSSLITLGYFLISVQIIIIIWLFYLKNK